jgi:TonB family protein
MTKLLCSVLCIALILPVFAYAQSDTTYLDNNFKPTNYENASYYRVLHKDPDGLYKVTDHYMSNRLQMEGHFSNIADETREGFFVFYTRRGFKEQQGYYSNGKPIGKWEHFYDSSDQVWYTENFSNGKPDGELVSYYKSGKIKRREHHNSGDNKITGVCYDENGSEIPFTQFLTMPTPLFDLNRFLKDNLIFPDLARNIDVEGRVLVNFIVSTDGSVTNVKVLKGVGRACDEEAMRVVSKFPKFAPAVIDDKSVKMPFTLPIRFALEK